jgi:hypothetical protein
MSWFTGEHARIYVSGYDMTPYIQSVDIGTDYEMGDVTALGSPIERHIPTTIGATASLEGIWLGPTDDLEPLVRSALGQATQQLLFLPGGDGHGQPARGLESHWSSWDVSEEAADVAHISAEMESSTAVELLRLHHPLVTEATAGASPGIQDRMATLAGGVMYAQAMEMVPYALTDNAGNSITNESGETLFEAPYIDINAQHADAGAGWSMVASTRLTPRSHARVPWNGVTKRWLRCAWSGRYVSATFVVALGRA